MRLYGRVRTDAGTTRKVTILRSCELHLVTFTVWRFSLCFDRTSMASVDFLAAPTKVFTRASIFEIAPRGPHALLMTSFTTSCSVCAPQDTRCGRIPWVSFSRLSADSEPASAHTFLYCTCTAHTFLYPAAVSRHSGICVESHNYSAQRGL